MLCILTQYIIYEFLLSLEQVYTVYNLLNKGYTQFLKNINYKYIKVYFTTNKIDNKYLKIPLAVLK